MYSPETIERCRKLRREGFTLGEIMEATGLPKTTVYDYIYTIPVCPKLKEKLERIKRENTKRLVVFNRKERRRRIVLKPEGWSFNLISLVAHFIFDGEIRDNNGCLYQNRNIVLINRVRDFVKEIFKLEPIYRFYPETGVHRISYFYEDISQSIF